MPYPADPDLEQSQPPYTGGPIPDDYDADPFAKQRQQEEAEQQKAEQAERTREERAQRQKAEDKSLVAQCEQRRDTYCDEGAAEIRRRRLEDEWHQYDAAVIDRQNTRDGRPPPTQPSQPRPPPAESLYDRNTKKNRNRQ